MSSFRKKMFSGFFVIVNFFRQVMPLSCWLWYTSRLVSVQSERVIFCVHPIKFQIESVYTSQPNQNVLFLWAIFSWLYKLPPNQNALFLWAAYQISLFNRLKKSPPNQNASFLLHSQSNLMLKATNRLVYSWPLLDLSLYLHQFLISCYECFCFCFYIYIVTSSV